MDDVQRVGAVRLTEGLGALPLDGRRCRPSILDDVRLSDGSLAWPLAQAAGISEVTFRKRLKSGLTPDVAATRPVRFRGARASARALADLLRRDLDEKARLASHSVSQGLRASRPACLSAGYAGVIWSDGACRVVVSPRGAEYAAQYFCAGQWHEERSFPCASVLTSWVRMVAVGWVAFGVSDVLAHLPDDPSDHPFVSGRRAFAR